MMKIATFDTSKISLELISELEEIVRKKTKMNIGTGYDFQTGIREWFFEGYK